jgi:hypothetical protein
VTEWFCRGFLGVGCARLVNFFLVRMVGRLVELLSAGGIAMQMYDPVAVVTVAVASPHRMQLTEAS